MRLLKTATPFTAPTTTLCLSQRDFEKALKLAGIENFNDRWLQDDCRGCVWDFTEEGIIPNFSIVCVDPTQSPFDIISTIIHESAHVWQNHCHFLGDSVMGRETEAYGIQSIAANLIWEFHKRVNHGTPATKRMARKSK